MEAVRILLNDHDHEVNILLNGNNFLCDLVTTCNKLDFEIIKKSGSWFSYGETKLGQGRDSVKQLIKDNPELADELEQKIKDHIKESNS